MSPGCKEFLFQPSRVTAGGLPISAAQCATLPFSSFTSNITMQCGLFQVNLVTVASFITATELAYAALPWCPKLGPQTVKRVTTNTKDMRSFAFIHASAIRTPLLKTKADARHGTIAGFSSQAAWYERSALSRQWPDASCRIQWPFRMRAPFAVR